MGNVKLSLSLVLFLVMTGCATGQLYNKELLPTLSADDEGRVFVYRRAIGGGIGIRPDISVDGKIIGQAVAGGYFFTDLPAGKHTLQAEQKVFTPKVVFDLKAGEEIYIKLRMIPGVFKGHIKPALVDNATGQSEIRKMKSL